jgi:hypothetical protein
MTIPVNSAIISTRRSEPAPKVSTSRDTSLRLNGGIKIPPSPLTVNRVTCPIERINFFAMISMDNKIFMARLSYMAFRISRVL